MTIKEQIQLINKELYLLTKPVDDLIEAFEKEESDLSKEDYYYLTLIQNSLTNTYYYLFESLKRFEDLNTELRNRLEEEYKYL